MISRINRCPNAVIGCAQHVLSQYAAKGVHQREGGIVADRPDVAEMVGKPLEFCQKSAEPNRAIRHHHLQRGFDRPRKGKRIRDRAVA